MCLMQSTNKHSFFLTSIYFSGWLTWSFILMISLHGVCNLGWRFTEKRQMIKTEWMMRRWRQEPHWREPVQLKSKWGPERLWFCWRSGSPGSRPQNRVEHGGCLLKSAVKINTCGRKKGSAGSRMVLLICPYQGWNDQALHLLFPSISSLLWTAPWRLWSCSSGAMWKHWPPKATLLPYTPSSSGIKSSTEASSGRASPCSPLILTSYFKDVETHKQKVSQLVTNLHLKHRTYHSVFLTILTTKIK